MPLPALLQELLRFLFTLMALLKMSIRLHYCHCWLMSLIIELDIEKYAYGQPHVYITPLPFIRRSLLDDYACRLLAAYETCAMMPLYCRLAYCYLLLAYDAAMPCDYVPRRHAVPPPHDDERKITLITPLLHDTPRDAGELPPIADARYCHAAISRCRCFRHAAIIFAADIMPLYAFVCRCHAMPPRRDIMLSFRFIIIIFLPFFICSLPPYDV